MQTHAAIIIKNPDDKVLFIQRSMKKKTLPGAWSFPSGTVKETEYIYDTTIRECKEELDIDANPSDIIASKQLPEFNVRLSFVLCNINFQHPNIKEPDEIENFEWMTFPEFFKRFSDKEIGHGLIWLRKNPHLLAVKNILCHLFL